MLPRLLYHYTSATALVGIVESRVIWASKIQYLNDATEFGLALQLVRQAVGRRAAAAPAPPRPAFLERLTERLEHAQRANVFVASLSELRDSLSQWRGYSPSAAGYCLAFDAAVLARLAARQGFVLHPCIYDPAEQHGLVDALLDRALDRLARASGRHGFDAAVDDTLARCVQLAPAIKHPGFADEREWRLVSAPIEASDPRLKVRPGRSTLVPYVPIQLVAGAGDALPLREICVGPTPHAALAREAVAMLVASAGVAGVDIDSSGVPYRDW